MSLEELLKRVEFTPGPWWACIGSDQPVPYYRGLVMYVSHDPQITICTGAEGDQSGRTCDSSEWEANARLIAAAPDMFEALLAVNRIVSEGAAVGFRWDDGDWAERLFKSQQGTSAALRKALGDQNYALLRALISQSERERATPVSDTGGAA